MQLINHSKRSFMRLGMALVTLSAAGSAIGQKDTHDSLYIIHFNDVHGFITPSDSAIGFAKIAGFIEDFKKKHPNTLVLDAGDNFVGSACTAYQDASGVLEVMNTIGIDAMTAGNADFVLGVPKLLKKAGQASFPILSANIVGDNGEALLQPSVIATTQTGFRVGIIGLTPPTICANLTKQKNKNFILVTQSEINRLKTQTDFIVALAHLGDNPNSRDTSLRLARETSGLDLIVDGHSHTVLPQGRIENDTLIVQAGEFSKYLGLVTIEFQDGRPVKSTAQLFDKNYFSTVPEKAETAAALAKVKTESDEYFSQVIGSSSVFLDGKREHVRTGETNLGNLMADAVREAAGADIGIIGAYAVGGEFTAGKINRGDFLTMMRVNVDLAIIEIKGSDLRDGLEGMLALWPEANGYFCQISGLSFELKPSPAGKVSELKINGKYAEPDTCYTVATFSNITQRKGFSNGRVIKPRLTNLETALLAYFEKHSPVAPALEDRIIVK